MSVYIDTGNLGTDPILRYTKEGKPLLNLRICVSHYKKNRDGEYEQQGLPVWYAATIDGLEAEELSKVLKKGYKVKFHAPYWYPDPWENNGKQGVQQKLHQPKILNYWPPRNQGNPPANTGQGQWGAPTDNPWAQPAQDQQPTQPTQNAPAQQEQPAAADPWVISNTDDNNPPF